MAKGKGALVEYGYGNGSEYSEGGKQFVVCKSHDALAVGDVVVVAYNASGPVTAAAATSTFPVRTGVVIDEASAAGEQIVVQVGGLCEAYVEGTTDVAAGDFLEVLNAENEFKKDGASRTTVSAAVAVDAQATDGNVLSTVYLIPEQHTIAAS